jgi:predicted DNA-binding protein (MmcQ/YjbR family)
MNKMFAITDIEKELAVALKCDPEKLITLREEYQAVRPPRYFDKKHWNHVAIDGSVDIPLIKEWIDESYDLIVASLPVKRRKELEEL